MYEDDKIIIIIIMQISPLPNLFPFFPPGGLIVPCLQSIVVCSAEPKCRQVLQTSKPDYVGYINVPQ